MSHEATDDDFNILMRASSVKEIRDAADRVRRPSSPTVDESKTDTDDDTPSLRRRRSSIRSMRLDKIARRKTSDAFLRQVESLDDADRFTQRWGTRFMILAGLAILGIGSLALAYGSTQRQVAIESGDFCCRSICGVIEEEDQHVLLQTTFDHASHQTILRSMLDVAR